MTQTRTVLVKEEELYEPWHIDDEEARGASWPVVMELPDTLIERFNAAKTEMESVWNELGRYERRAG